MTRNGSRTGLIAGDGAGFAEVTALRERTQNSIRLHALLGVRLAAELLEVGQSPTLLPIGNLSVASWPDGE
ncbi:MAG: hypothetical protein N2037_11920 [Acidimicrobiales bacterium]|nr:hypothetical protein [Acidimicrobiales bacterium]